MSESKKNVHKWKWFADFEQRVANEFESAYNDSDPEFPPKSICVDYDCFNDGCMISIEMYRDGRTFLYMYHDGSDNESDFPNIKEYILENLPSWDDYLEWYRETHQPYDEWNEHGFRDEADYWHYRLG